MDADQRRAIEHDAERTIVRFFHYLDTRAYEKLAGLMAPEGVWNRQGKALKGRDMVLAAMHARPKGFTTQHLVTNLVVDVVDADHAEANYYLTVFAHQLAEGGQLPAPMEAPLLAAFYQEKLVRTPQGWRINNISDTVAFKR